MSHPKKWNFLSIPGYQTYARKMYTGMGIRSYELMDDG